MNRAYNVGKRPTPGTSGNSGMLPPTGPGRVHSQNTSMSASGQPAKRLLSNTGARRCVRGELLTNGYKSLRAQGMLRAVKVDEDTSEPLIGRPPVVANSTNSAVKQSKELEHVNICIEKTAHDVNLENEDPTMTVSKRVSSEIVTETAPANVTDAPAAAAGGQGSTLSKEISDEVDRDVV